MSTASPQLPFLKGTVDMLVLKALSWGPMHGFGVAIWIEEQSLGTLGLNDSVTYQILHRLEGRGFISAEWKVTENNRRARYYKLTASGRAHLAAQTDHWLRYSQSVTAILAINRRPVSV